MAHGAVIPIGLHTARERSLSHYLVPDLYAPSVAEIDFTEVREYMGLAESDPLNVLSDLDGTLRVAMAPQLHEPTAKHLAESLNEGVITRLAVTPNSMNPGVDRFGWQIRGDVPTFSSYRINCKKPQPEFYERIIDAMGVGGEPILIMGDKVTRDVLGARRLGRGAVSLLVHRLGDADLPADRIIGRRLDNTARKLGQRVMHATNRCKLALGMV
ncbi:MAG TPA: HAD hydrolase-like protein [Candidatus Saccharimonadales bacterium]|nr:HAD hydrolase-like protein [Candidatus Saccharimonadales bacterium]